MGPTAAGKTALAIELCKHLDTEIISVDSALVYKGMDVGTAKPDCHELAQAPHHLIDLIDPRESYSVADFRRDAIVLIDKLHAQGKVPVLVGGTMMYFKGLIEGLSPLPEASEDVRAQLEKEAAEKGWQALHAELTKIDPDAAAKISENDSQRINRAIEVYRITGKPMSLLQKQKQPELPYTFYQFAIAPNDRKILHERIEKRFKIMLEQGFKNEVLALYHRDDLHPDLPSIRCVGYRQMWEHLSGECDYDEMVFRGIAATRQLAKRQLTWLRSWPNVTWLETGEQENLQRILSSLS
ncbi:tRNA (adenosine(37)-N6)-dimethylallyltransferase MiaA [Pseudoalteromonas luteoviolacea]|uniref:tRNA dimethylallyltransferase n=2 Tax=Pseudoalteromonas luteoviolacea TaxID=43657 RepID=A0A0F6A5S7_9GAMM|nr:tRNA (adenosine(37)-N6)-dimethylallyltransferase MiaA [Pseudoalteromonas luteoviolacea]AOT15067.1 tRNA (adenosine(37)-N6)-dimethylallyltransferase MiaA [Pseudoalteromonas luteoviolacea]AOT19983.1 tRNA (adenosine(37)-N6)-dimethylallyltransferase MiaA [Pseudoalteromonas luteoviolacea]KKE81557.1 tRNA delta(2)-isopentenylpyrophosphate transferase [Pseudoalteromonas luteoviolacea S4054]KZN70001.1 tRNA delta(2)-isopentenylpyrophosphate transferase [Pseudoalteromonas luteoviolacea S4047-1]